MWRAEQARDERAPALLARDFLFTPIKMSKNGVTVVKTVTVRDQLGLRSDIYQINCTDVNVFQSDPAIPHSGVDFWF